METETDNTTETPKASAAEWISRIIKNPVLLVVMAGPVATYLVTEYVNPAVMEGIEAHAVDPNAHPAQFERLAAIEDKLAEMEEQAGKDTETILDLLSELKGEE